MFNMWMLVWEQYKFHKKFAILRMLTIAFVLLLLFRQYLLALPISGEELENAAWNLDLSRQRNPYLILKFPSRRKFLAEDTNVSSMWRFSDWDGYDDICEFEKRLWKYPPIDYKWDTNLLIPSLKSKFAELSKGWTSTRNCQVFLYYSYILIVLRWP